MPASLTFELPRTSPEQEGIASAALLRVVEALESQVHEIHSFMLLRHGHVVAEGWWSPYAPEYPHTTFSLSKSFVSTAMGLAVAEGRLTIDDAVLSFFPDEVPLQANDFRALMAVRHLLTMTTGHALDTLPRMEQQPDGNWIHAFFDTPVLYKPGTHFLYNSGATYMLAAILQRVTGIGLLEYLGPRLFEPLGIRDATWHTSPQGIAIGSYGLSIKTEDIARFGQLYLQKGVWAGQRILPEAWVEAATSKQVSNGDSTTASDWAQGYGYQFWRNSYGGYRGSGLFGQYCIVLPEQDAVLALTAGIEILDFQHFLNLVWEMLLPSLNAEPPSDDPVSQAALANKLSNLAFPPVQGAATSPLASSISGRTYGVDANDLKIEALAFGFTEQGCVLSIQTAFGGETFLAGYGTWQHGYTTLFRKYWLPDEAMPIFVSGAWTAQDTLTMVMRLVETPFFYTFVCHFVGHELMIEAQVNVTFESAEPLLLTGHASPSDE